VDAAGGGAGGTAGTGGGGAGQGGAGQAGSGAGAGGAATDSGHDAGGSDADRPPPITEDEFCALKAAQECQVTARCLTETSVCVAQRKALCLDAGALARSSGTRLFRPGATAACIEKTAAVYAKPIVTPADVADMNDVCAYVYQGDVALLSPCATKYDCDSPALICDKGFCGTLMVRAAGTPCGNPGEICGTGAYCGQNTAGIFVCLARGNSGDACDATRLCLEALRCATTCDSRRAAGQSCASNDDCAAAAPFCDPFASSVCTAGLTFATGAPSCAAFGGAPADAAMTPG
jgi:hypothetical protein